MLAPSKPHSFPMLERDPTSIPWMDKPADKWVLPDPLDLTFEGFAPEAFAILERLREHPHIEQYREEKTGIRRFITEPFKRFRDDLVVNWVLPNRLDFETEKNVFSRLLKNDFGAGGCHHHLWMAFYRPGLRRLTDVQLSHSITPKGFSTGLFVGDYAKALLRQAKTRIAAEPARFLALVNPLLQSKKLCIYHTTGKQKMKTFYDGPLDELPPELFIATGFLIRCYVCREEAQTGEGSLVRWSLDRLRCLWPLYRFFSEGTSGFRGQRFVS